MKLLPVDPMRTRATDNGPADGWRGARVGAEERRRVRLAFGQPTITWLFLAASLLVTLWEFSTFGASPTPSELSRAGGAGVGSVATGAWWKLLTANLLHANLPHLVVNTFLIVLTGRWLEHLGGHTLVAATILWAGLLSSAGSLLIDVPHVSIGASGVAFGLLGCAIAVDPRARTPLGTIARPLAVVNLIATFLIPGISIGGHLGGFVAGLLVGWLGYSRAAATRRPHGRRRLAVAAIAVVAALPLVALLAVGPDVLPGEARELRGSIVAPLLSRQLSGTTLSSGQEIDDADCAPAAGDPRTYSCDVDDGEAFVDYSRVDDQWSLSYE